MGRRLEDSGATVTRPTKRTHELAVGRRYRLRMMADEHAAVVEKEQGVRVSPVIEATYRGPEILCVEHTWPEGQRCFEQTVRLVFEQECDCDPVGACGGEGGPHLWYMSPQPYTPVANGFCEPLEGEWQDGE